MDNNISEEIKKLQDAFKPVIEILKPYMQGEDVLKYEQSLTYNYTKFLKLKRQLMEVQKDMQKDSFNLDIAQQKFKKHLESLKDE